MTDVKILYPKLSLLEQEVIDMLCTLNANKAVGPDIISNRMLVSVKEEISKPLCSLFNKSLREKVFPSDWKIAHVITLFKNGDKSLQSNYRPISLLSCVSKVLEKIIFKHVFNHLLENNVEITKQNLQFEEKISFLDYMIISKIYNN
jgi:hypothetical protein